MADKTNANIGFEKQLWDAACVLWGHIPAAEYRKVIIGLIFLRYISAAFDKRREELIEEGDGFEDDRDAYTMENVFFVPEEARWSNIASNAHTPEIGSIIDNAMRAIESENKTLKNVLPKNYASPDLDKRILGDVVDIFTNNIVIQKRVKIFWVAHMSIVLLNLQRRKVLAVVSSTRHLALLRHWFLFCAHLIIAVCMTVVVGLVVCLFRVKNLLRHTAEKEEIFQYTDRKQIQILGKWRR